MREIENSRENLEKFLNMPLLRIYEGFISGIDKERTPIRADIGYLKQGDRNSLWLLEGVSLNRVNDKYIKGCLVHDIFGLSYQSKKDLSQVQVCCLTYEHFYEFGSNDEAEKILNKLKIGDKIEIK